ncbi:MAG: hypothetical protein V1891_01725 [bacterium]
MTINSIVSAETKSNNKNLMPIFELFNNSYIFLKKNLKNFILITLATYIPIFALQFIMNKLFLQNNENFQNTRAIAAAFFLLLSFFAIALFSIIQQITLISFIDKKKAGGELNILEIYRANKKYFLQYFWINILIFLITISGALGIFFTIALSAIFKETFASKYILAILISLNFILAITIFIYIFYLLICFMFSRFALICENIKGLEAIKKSKTLVKGRWWNIILRIAILNLIFFAISLLSFFINLIPQKIISGTLMFIFALIFSLFAIPFSAVYFYFIYTDLKR